MSGLPPAVRRELEELLGRRPWPPPEPTRWGEALEEAIGRTLEEHGAEPPHGVPLPHDVLVVVPAELAPELRSRLLAAGLLVASGDEWERVAPELREEVERAGLLLVARPAGDSPADWVHLLPTGTRSVAAIEARHAGELHAVTSELAIPALGTLVQLQVLERTPDGLALVSDLSGVLELR